MKFLKYKLSLLSLVLLAVTITFTSCEDNESGVEIIGLDAGFIVEMVDSRTVSFVNTSNRATSFTWDLGDGTTTNVSNPSRRYVNGTYTVRLTASNDEGQTSVFEDTIIIDG